MKKMIIFAIIFFIHFSDAQSLPFNDKQHTITQTMAQCGQFRITLPVSIHLENQPYVDHKTLFITKEKSFMHSDHHYANQFDSERLLDSLHFSINCLPKTEAETHLWPYHETIIEDDSNPRGIETWALKEMIAIQAKNSHGKMAIIEHSGIQMWTTDVHFCLIPHNSNYQLCGSSSINNLRQTQQKDAYQPEIIQLLHLTVISWVKSIQFLPNQNQLTNTRLIHLPKVR
ncbi:hypothetical protein [Neisseria sp. Ec49-e6-T10]|uniref:hypothetical protein n=1 Tax=Neisseria sp. Ec49-e6-T10 TaxID=3140744 RepID=UPI003EBA629D